MINNMAVPFKVVLAHGCFDLLHLGHIRHLTEARKLGDKLIVSVTSDRFVNKGLGRPRFTEAERAEALSALSCVDEVKINDSPDACLMIERMKPAFYVKGIDYADAKDDERLTKESAAVAACGGEMVFTSSRKWSSTELLDDFEADPFGAYLDVLRNVECDGPFEQALEMMSSIRGTGFRLFFVGNGGSAAIASHMAADFQKAGGIPAMAFNDAPAVTALANDVSYDMVFADQLRMHRQSGDVLIAISSSGRSPNIHEAIDVARDGGMKVITLSGFNADNPLRTAGDVNFYVPSNRYGVVETAHLAILHSLLDASVDALR
jgi:D-sedoheptulose 7-phosphate isomerase